MRRTRQQRHRRVEILLLDRSRLGLDGILWQVRGMVC